MNRPPWRVTASSYALDTRFLRLRKDTIELPDGTVIEDYYVRESHGFVVIYALTRDGRVPLVHQYKHGIARELLELPAGAIDPGETPIEAAIRELAEETGYEARSFELLRTFITDPTNADTIAYLFLARDAERTREQHLDATESIDVRLATADELLAHVRDGSIDSVAHVAAIYLVRDLLEPPA